MLTTAKRSLLPLAALLFVLAVAACAGAASAGRNIGPVAG
jgi:hypothetical protein